MSKKIFNIYICKECMCKKQAEPETYNESYADINGIRLARKNEELSFCEYFTYDEAMRLFEGKSGKRLPKHEQWEKMLETGCTWDDEKKGIWIGKRHTKKRETNQSTFLPAAGSRFYNDGTLNDRGYNGYYWSSTVYDSSGAYSLSFNSGSQGTGNTNESYGFSVRCLA